MYAVFYRNFLEIRLNEFIYYLRKSYEEELIMYNLLKMESIHKQFNEKKLSIEINRDIIDTLILADEIFVNFLKSQLEEDNNPFLKQDIKNMKNVGKELSKLNGFKKDKVILNITVAEFLIFTYGIQTVEKMIEYFKPSQYILNKYVDFINEMKKIYNSLNQEEIKLYYDLIASYDNPNSEEELNLKI